MTVAIATADDTRRFPNETAFVAWLTGTSHTATVIRVLNSPGLCEEVPAPSPLPAGASSDWPGPSVRPPLCTTGATDREPPPAVAPGQSTHANNGG